MENAFTFLLMIGFLSWSGYYWWKIINMRCKKSMSKMWPLAIAKITKKDISVSHTGLGRSSPFTPKVTYVFSVLGNEITNTISLDSDSQKDMVTEALEGLGETIKTRYNPDNPKENIAEIENVRIGDIFGALLPLIVVVMCLRVLLFGSDGLTSVHP